MYIFTGYLGLAFPAARLLQGLPLASHFAFCIVPWGIITACFAAYTNNAGAVTLRFFLGLPEATMLPGCLLLMSQVCCFHSL